MSFFSMILFHKLFGIYSECSKKYEKDSYEYKKCKKLQEFNDNLYQRFLQDNLELLEQYIQMLDYFQNQRFLLQLYAIQKKIDNEIEQYISLDEQMEFLKEFFELDSICNDLEYDR